MKIKLFENARFFMRTIYGHICYWVARDYFLRTAYAKDYFFYMRGCKCKTQSNGTCKTSANCFRTDVQRGGRFCVSLNPHYKTKGYKNFLSKLRAGTLNKRLWQIKQEEKN